MMPPKTSARPSIPLCLPGRCATGPKLRSNGLSFHEFRLRFALFPVVGIGRIDVARGFVSASVVSRVMAVNRSRIKGKGRYQTAPLHPFTRALPRYLKSHEP
ncbi:hypothetical protein AVEN_63164-1 [Araneus ventricosus]|uniref:Uncharacterized protein n=1 Tax=Araneus ventricosus TaxID=182803 RepID=A0A4Y2B0H1_ARAVE|nr:hypothetical protein AVEN_63164-1 [Araneus ventricosus]